MTAFDGDPLRHLMRQTLFMPRVAALNAVVIKDFVKALQQTRELLRKHSNKRVVVHFNLLLSFTSNVYATSPITKLI